MDGLQKTTGRKSILFRFRSASELFVFFNRTPSFAACIIVFTLLTSASSADRPGAILKSSFAKNAKKIPIEEIPPSPITDGPETSADPANKSINEPRGRSGRTPVPSPEMQRFPQKPKTSAESEIPLPSDFLLLDSVPVTPIDLPTALKLAGVNSPDVLIAQQRVLATTARQQLAAAQALPSLNLGTNYDSHTGALQRSTGELIDVNRSSLYVGAGAVAMGAGTVNVPGLQYNLNVADTYYTYLVRQQQSERFQAAAVTTQNNLMLQVTTAYCQLIRQQGTRSIAIKAREGARDIVRITADYARVGQGMPADAERARTEVGRREADVLAADSAIIEASARLAQLLNLQSSVRLESSENWAVPRSVVPDPIPLPELIATALYLRPEIAERRAEVHAAMLELDKAHMLIFSPQFIAGFSDGAFGGGSNINTATTGAPLFGNFGNRTDEDIILYWSIRNLGLGNRALIKTSTARLAATNWERTQQLNDIRANVADAYARTQTRAAQLDIRLRAIHSSEEGFREDYDRARAGEGRPIEVLDSLRLLAKAQLDYLDTITAYNLAQYELYVAIGQPPADLLVHESPPSHETPPSPVKESK